MVQEPKRSRLPADRRGVTRRFKIGNLKGYFTVNEVILAGKPAPVEIFMYLAKSGGALHAFMDAVAQLASMCLQYGVPLEILCEKFIGWRFEPCGYVEATPDIKYAYSVLDYIFRWLAIRYLGKPWLKTFDRIEHARLAMRPPDDDDDDAEA